MKKEKAAPPKLSSPLPSHALLAAIVQGAEDAVISQGLGGLILSWNDGAERLYGYRGEEIVGQPILLLVPPDRTDELPAILERLRRGEHVSPFDTVRLRRDGTSMAVSVSVSPVQDAAGHLVGTSEIGRDITARQQADDDVRRVMTTARAMIWHATVLARDGGMDWDLRISNEEAGARLWPVAVTPGQSFGEAWFQARLPEDVVRADVHSARALRSGQLDYSQEFRIRLADGSVRWLGEDVQIERVGEGRWHLVGVFTDITERKGEQEALRDVLSGVRCVVWNAQVSAREAGMAWKINIFNEPAVRRWLDVPVASGQRFAEAWAAARLPEEAARCNATAVAAIERGQTGYSQEYRVRLADGQIRWLAEDVQIEAQGPEEWHLAGVCTDITERKEAEEVRAALHERDRRIAETWHRSMLHEVPAGAFPRLDVKTFYEAALEESQVGGDFFDAFVLSDQCIALVVGDVSGKGLAAAGHTAEIKYALRAFLHAFPDPGEALSHLNDLLCRTQPPLDAGEATLVVLSLAVVDQGSGEAAFAVAGGDPPLILRASGAAEPVGAGGRLLGMEADAVYAVARQRLAVGDTLLMATDGIMEARRGRVFLGNEGLAALAEAVGAAAPLTEMGQAILRGARDFTRGPLRDDVCLLLARRP